MRQYQAVAMSAEREQRTRQLAGAAGGNEDWDVLRCTRDLVCDALTCCDIIFFTVVGLGAYA